MAVLFQFGVEKRATEVGTLLAIGFTPKRVRRLLLFEGAILALLGSVLGVPGGILYARAMLYGLATIWRSAVNTSALAYSASAVALINGAFSGLFIALVTIWLALRKQARQPARELLAEGAESEFRLQGSARSSRGVWIGWLSGACAMLLLGWAGMQHQAANPESFFFAGTLLLISGLGFASAGLSALTSIPSSAQPSLSALGVRNAGRRHRRSLATVSLLACGSFLIAAIGAFKLDGGLQAGGRTSGTGGFAFIGESALPIVQDLNTEKGREFFGLSSNDLPAVRFVSFRVHDGEDASCLNLNRAQTPRLLGVRPEQLSRRQAFTFAGFAPGVSKDNPWLLLKQPQADGSVPAIADAESIEWILGKKPGDTLAYTDEHGRAFKVRLVASLATSILQGSLVISENDLLAHYPGETGARVFLIDVPPAQAAARNLIEQNLVRATQDYGLELVPAVQRMAELNAVQNTYLNTFQVLGGLGLLLGSLGLGVVVLRNVLERRGELGLLAAVGFRSRALKWVVMSEHGALLLLGLVIGAFAALVAVLPNLLSPSTHFPVRSLSVTLAGILVSGLIWTWLATQLALRGEPLEALRDE
jgi:ABC-type lipoprotein release transport system permease subunit